MSIRLMSQVWSHGPDDRTELLVMLALADFANDDGMCWPSIKSIAQKARLKERGTQQILRRLEASGMIKISTGGGRHGCNQYTINPAQPCTPAQDAPLHSHAPPPCTAMRFTLHSHAPEPSRTVNEPSVEDNARAKPQKSRLPEGWVPDAQDVEYAFSQKLTENEIQEIADDFHAYWRDRTDAGGRKSERGWKQAWKNRCRDQAPKFIRNRRMAGGQISGGYGQGGGIAGVVARRQFGGEV